MKKFFRTEKKAAPKAVRSKLQQTESSTDVRLSKLRPASTQRPTGKRPERSRPASTEKSAVTQSARSRPASTEKAKLRTDQWISIGVIVLSLGLHSSYVPQLPEAQALADYTTLEANQQNPDPDLEIEIASIPVFKSQSGQTLAASIQELDATLSAESIYVSDEVSGAVLLSKNENQVRAPASTTKLMTALVARAEFDQTDVVTVKAEAFSEGNTMGLVLGEQITVESLLFGLLVASGNDAAFALANHHPLGYDGFVAKMNSLADVYHLDTSSFRNPSGLDQSDHQVTARDLTILAREAFKDPLLTQIMRTTRIKVTDITRQNEHYLTHTHSLIGREQGVEGGKTGTTFEAGEALVTKVTKNDHPIIITVLKSQDRYGDTTKIIDWVYANYAWQDLVGSPKTR